jgi:peptide/nickel transport system permease protein
MTPSPRGGWPGPLPPEGRRAAPAGDGPRVVLGVGARRAGGEDFGVGAYVIRRILLTIPTLLVISVVIFAILALAPGDPMAGFAANPSVPPEVRANIRHDLGLDQPWPIRYEKWLVAVAHGDLGYSFASRAPVLDLIGQRLPTTLAVIGAAYVLSVIIAIPVGVLSAVRRYTILDHVITALAFIGFSVPTFFSGVLLIIVFSVKLHWLPFIYDSSVQVHDLPAQIKQSIMPIAVLTLFQAATLVRYVRAEMLENLPRDYVRTAYAKGLRPSIVVGRHALRNSLLPIITLVALGVPGVFAGAVITEQIFRVPGIGDLLISSINSSDTPVVMAVTFIYAVLVVIFNLIADLLYGVVDPRIRYR